MDSWMAPRLPFAATTAFRVLTLTRKQSDNAGKQAEERPAVGSIPAAPPCLVKSLASSLSLSLTSNVLV